jgi:uncharacterized integral membrane protein
MIKRFIGWFILVPISVILIIFALANRQMIKLNFDPTSSLNPLISSIELPLYFIIYSMLFLGILLGGVAVWFTQGRYRKQCRQLSKTTKTLESEIGEIKKTTKKPIDDKSLLSANDLL